MRNWKEAKGVHTIPSTTTATNILCASAIIFANVKYSSWVYSELDEFSTGVTKQRTNLW